MTTTSPPLAPLFWAWTVELNAIAVMSSASKRDLDMSRFLLCKLIDFGGSKRARARSQKAFKRFPAKGKKQGWCEQSVQQRRTQKTAENGAGHRMANFTAWFVRC